MGSNITTNVSSSNFFQLDGGVFTTTGIGTKFNFKKGSVGLYAGAGMDYSKAATFKGGVFDVTGGLNYGELGDYGDWKVNGGCRIRTVVFDDKKYVQLRLQPFNASYKINDKIKVSYTPYVATKFDLTNNKTKTQAGMFAGASYDLGKATITIEGQCYDLTSFTTKDISGNLILTIPLESLSSKKKH